MATRRQVHCEIFGHPKLLSDRVLPTFRDIMLHYLYVQNDLKYKSGGKDPGVSEILKNVIPKIEEIWQSASIPIVSRNRIWDKLKKFHERYKQIQKNLKSRKNTETMQGKISNFKEEASKLFDIAACKCDFSQCKCDKLKKVPTREREFLTDQRTIRIMAIGAIDVASTKKNGDGTRKKGKSSLQTDEIREHAVL